MMQRSRRGLATVLLFLFCIGVVSPGCYTYRVHAPGHTGATEVKGEVVWSLAWGLVQENPTIDNCQGQALSEVVVKSNLAFDLLTVLSLGLVSPKRVEWICDKAHSRGGTIPMPAATGADSSSSVTPAPDSAGGEAP